MVWIQLLRIVQIEKAGVSRAYYPGDWVDVGRQSAQRWVTDGVARWATPQTFTGDLTGCGVALMGDVDQAERIRALMPQLAIEPLSKPELPFAKTLLWQTDFPLRPELIVAGFQLLEAWEVAAPLGSYDQLAVHIGTTESRERTRAVVRDLRVPLYTPGMMFVKRCRVGEELLTTWATESETGDDPRLALLRAIYLVKPLICALPVTWSKAISAIA